MLIVIGILRGPGWASSIWRPPPSTYTPWVPAQTAGYRPVFVKKGQRSCCTHCTDEHAKTSRQLPAGSVAPGASQVLCILTSTSDKCTCLLCVYLFAVFFWSWWKHGRSRRGKDTRPMQGVAGRAVGEAQDLWANTLPRTLYSPPPTYSLLGLLGLALC